MQPDNEATFGVGPVDRGAESASVSVTIDEMPLPSDPKAIFLGGIFILSALAAAYVASEIIVPLIFAIILRLMFQPAMRFLAYLRVPRTLAALALIICSVRVDHRFGRGDFRPGAHMGEQTAGRRSTPPGAPEFHERACSYGSAVPATA
jgi:hypothetical protein